MPDFVDDNGRRVLTFTTKARNLSRVAELTDAVVDIALSGAWRDYHTAVGHEAWREAELDYFLIACDLRYDDVARVLAYNKDAKELAPMVDKTADSDRRRPLEDAAKTWPSPSGESLADRARRLGWLGDNGVMRVAPIPERARAAARHGVTFEEHARQERAKRIPTPRRRELDKLVAATLRELADDQERRYFIEQIAPRRAGRMSSTAAELTTWRADAERLDWDTAALAAHWGVASRTAQHRVKRLRE